MAAELNVYAARLQIDYPERLDRRPLSFAWSGSFPSASFWA
jgi:hypothetical protein